MRFDLSYGVLFACFLLLLPGALLAQSSPPTVPGPPPVPQATVSVDCDAGETVGDALATRADELTVEFTGTCRENLIIERDRVTLRGTGAARLEGASGVAEPTLLARGASPLRLESFTAANALRSTLVLVRGTHAVLDGVEVVESGNRGLALDFGASAEVIESSFRNGRFGIAVEGGSFVETTGLVEANDNAAAGILLSTGAEIRAGFGDPLVAENNGVAGLATQLHGFAQVFELEVRGSTIGIFTDTESRYFGEMLTVENVQIGAFLDYQAAIDTVGTLEASAVGVVAGNQSSFAIGSRGADPSTVTGDVSLDNSVGNFVNTSLPDAVALSFGTRASFFGSTVGTLICDDTVLVRGSVSCPPVPSLRESADSVEIDVRDLRRRLFGQR